MLLVVTVLAAVYALLDMGSAPLDAQIRTSVVEKRGLGGVGGGGGSGSGGSGGKKGQ